MIGDHVLEEWAAHRDETPNLVLSVRTLEGPNTLRTCFRRMIAASGIPVRRAFCQLIRKGSFVSYLVTVGFSRFLEVLSERARYILQGDLCNLELSKYSSNSNTPPLKGKDFRHHCFRSTCVKRQLRKVSAKDHPRSDHRNQW